MHGTCLNHVDNGIAPRAAEAAQSMSDTCIRITNLSKRYQIGARRNHHDTLRDQLADAFLSPIRRLSSLIHHSTPNGDEGRSTNTDWIWALKDISIEVRRGEVLGIIGRNGAGKSTLLKILSRITKPTEGCAEIHGRLASLLEVGTGFHSELTGRENIYLNGSILGMTRAEIARKFDAMVAFAEVEKFIDTPVKHYSSGMYVRLAFSVAAHLEPEILLVDEVLAVGDSAFQKKCLGKMGDVAREGRTVLFVSHSMSTVNALCARGIVLHAGQVLFDGHVQEAIEQYTRMGLSRALVQDLSNVTSRTGNGDIRLTAFWIEDSSHTPSSTVLNGRPCTFVLCCQVQDERRSIDNVAVTVGVKTVLGSRVFYHHNLLTGQVFNGITGKAEVRLYIPRLPLSAGNYFLDLNLSYDNGRTMLDSIRELVSFEVCDGDFFHTGAEYRGGIDASVMVDGT